MYKLHNWYIEHRDRGCIAWGNVTGHERFPDSMIIHTSLIQDATINGDEVTFKTMNSEYTCKAKSFKSNKFPELQDANENNKSPWIEKVLNFINGTSFLEDYVEAHDEVIMFLGNTQEYYFGKVVIDWNGEYRVEKDMYPHIGMFQDSVICDYWVGESCIDLRYFPYQGNKLQFYCVDKPENIKLSIENIGESELTVGILGRVYKLKSGERQEVTKIEPGEEAKDINGNDLYPAVEL